MKQNTAFCSFIAPALTKKFNKINADNKFITIIISIYLLQNL